MKKSLTLLIAMIILVAGLVVLTGCGNKSDNNEKGNGVDLILDFFNHKTTYIAHVKLNEGDGVTEHEEDELESARIENIEKNYIIDLTLDEDAKEAYEQFKSSARENEVFEEVKFGKYEGYYSNGDEDTIFGYIILDNHDSDAYIYLMFCVYFNDGEHENIDIKDIYTSSNIQNVLNNVELKTSELKVEE